LAEEYRGSQAGLLEVMADENAWQQFRRDFNLPAWVDIPTSLANLDRYHEQALQVARKPYYERQAVEVPNDPLCQQLLPALESAGLRVALAEARAHLTLAAAALHLYRLRQGDYPADWDALTPDTLLQAPADPFRAAPLVYRQEGDGYQLYSVGPDGDDDDGAARPWKELQADADGDLVWGEI
jgi:hypothetical protein